MRCETVVVEAGNQHGETLIPLLCVHGVWLPQAKTLFDTYVVDTDTQTYMCHTPSRVLFNAEVEKKDISMQMPVQLNVPILHSYVFLLIV